MSFNSRSRQVPEREEEEARRLAAESRAPKPSTVSGPIEEPVISSNLDSVDLLLEPKPRRWRKTLINGEKSLLLA